MNTSASQTSDVPHTLARALREKRESLYGSGRAPGEDGSWVSIRPAGVTRERGQALGDLVREEKAGRCLETGFALGLSTSFLLEATLSGSLPERSEGARVVSIDPFQTADWHGSGRRHLREAGAGDLHRCIEKPSEVGLPELIAQGSRFDLAFIDGDHRFEHVFLDVFYCRRLVGPGKLLVLDDDWMPSVKKCAAFFTSSGLCSWQPTKRGTALDEFTLLRVEAGGDDRVWTHYQEF
jgi:predicted O-methyltransferase YrrM